MIGAPDVHGMRALMTVEGGTDVDVFEAFLEQVLVRKLRPGDIVVLDNVGAHKPNHTRSLIEAAGGLNSLRTRSTGFVVRSASQCSFGNS